MNHTCSVEGCKRLILARGWCGTHYSRWSRRGAASPETPISVYLPTSERFWSRVVKTETCWLWQGALNSGGYGSIGISSRVVMVHRYAYELLVGPIPEGLTIDHLCFTTNCVRPEHLEVVSMRENILRGDSLSARRARQTHCKNGHPFDAENTRYTKKGERVCRTCDRAKQAARKKAA